MGGGTPPVLGGVAQGTPTGVSIGAVSYGKDVTYFDKTGAKQTGKNVRVITVTIPDAVGTGVDTLTSPAIPGTTTDGKPKRNATDPASAKALASPGYGFAGTELSLADTAMGDATYAHVYTDIKQTVAINEAAVTIGGTSGSPPVDNPAVPATAMNITSKVPLDAAARWIRV